VVQIVELSLIVQPSSFTGRIDRVLVGPDPFLDLSLGEEGDS
jgi:hypothetical protein